MTGRTAAHTFLRLEAEALLTRLDQVKPFALRTPSVAAAALTPAASTGIDRHLLKARAHLVDLVRAFADWVSSPAAASVPPQEIQRRFTVLKLKFNALLDDLDIFADVITQRADHEIGVHMSGLDVVAADALRMDGYFQAPPVVCYLDRGHGAAIRRARTRLPGGDENPVAVIRVPRERMVGSGIASSLIHEVGHQGAASLGLVDSLRPVLRAAAAAAQPGPGRDAWTSWERWISEIIADFWSVSRVGIGASTGLVGVVSLPPYFVFRWSGDDPHPTPWIRVLLSIAMGEALYPEPQWKRLAALWQTLYPSDRLAPAQRARLVVQAQAIQPFVALLMAHRPKSLRGQTIGDTFRLRDRAPGALRAIYGTWLQDPSTARKTPPALAFAVLAQARADGRITPTREASVLMDLLTRWALGNQAQLANACASIPKTVRPSTGAAPILLAAAR